MGWMCVVVRILTYGFWVSYFTLWLSSVVVGKTKTE